MIKEMKPHENSEEAKELLMDLGDILTLQILDLDDRNKFLTIRCASPDNPDDIYAIAIPGIMYKKVKKEEIFDGKGRVGSAGLQKAPTSEEKSDSGEEKAN